MVKQKTNMLTKKSNIISKYYMCLTCQCCLSLRKKNFNRKKNRKKNIYCDKKYMHKK